MGKTDEISWIPLCEQACGEALRQFSFAEKSKEWKYEGGRRLLFRSLQSNADPIFRPYPHEAIKEVILSERMVNDYQVRIFAVMKKLYPEVPVRTARRAKGAYTLVID